MDESLKSFVLDLQNLVKTCGYQDPYRQVCDRLVIGFHAARLPEKLHLSADLSLHKVEEIDCRRDMITSRKK